MTGYWELTEYHWAQIEEELQARLSPCRLCPRNCGVNRPQEIGACGVAAGPRVGFVSFLATNFSPEKEGKPVGYVQFSGCQLKCTFCCYYENTQLMNGEDTTPEELADTLLDMQRAGFKAVILSTATHQAPWAAQALHHAAQMGVRLPVLLETAGYESLEVLDVFSRMVSGYIVGWKFAHDDVAARYVGVGDYVSRVKMVTEYLARAIWTGIKLDEGAIIGGLSVRLLVMPGLAAETMAILDWLADNVGTNVAVQVLDCYHPQWVAKEDPVLGRKAIPEEVEGVLGYARQKGFSTVFV